MPQMRHAPLGDASRRGRSILLRALCLGRMQPRWEAQRGRHQCGNSDMAEHQDESPRRKF
jgi:hypothetical protein